MTTNRSTSMTGDLRLGNRTRSLIRAATIMIAVILLQSTYHGRAQVFTLEIPGTVPWTDTGLDIVAGSQLNITATGMVRFAYGGPEGTTNPDGVGPPGGYDGTTRQAGVVYSNTIVLTLIGKVGGTTEVGTGIPVPEGISGRGPGFVGSSYSQVIPTTGRLFLGYNDHPPHFGDNSGSFSVSGSILRSIIVATEPTPLTETSGVASIRVERLRNANQPATIHYSVTGGTATPGADFFLTNGVLEFAAGVTNLTIPLTIIDDALREGSETIILGLTNSASGWVAQEQLKILDSDSVTLHVWQGSPNPTPPYVSWATAATNIQDAVDAALPGETVLVTNGVYATGEREGNRVAITNSIRLESVNGPLVTTIEGNGIRCVYLGTHAMLSGFTLTNGIAPSGGGVYCEAASAVVSNCVITENWATDAGGACGGTLHNCTLIGNRAGRQGGGAEGGILNDCSLSGNEVWNLHPGGGGGGGAAGCTLSRCTLSGNWADRGGGAAGGSLYNCVLTSNSAGAGGGAADATLHNCTLTGNSAGEGGGSSGGTLYNCILTENYGGGASGVLRNCVVADNEGGSDGEFYNCTVVHNKSGISGSAFNSILYYNAGGNYEDGTSLNYCCTTPLPTNGVGNIAVDPQMASATYLSRNSPCIGAGSAAYANGLDIDGEPWANPPCIGADQLTPGNATGAITVGMQADHTNVVAGFVVSLVGEVEGRVLRSVWDFGDGTSATNRPYARHAWDSPGLYTVRLTAYNDSHPQGVSTTKLIFVQESGLVYYVNAINPTPAFPYTSWPSAATTIQEAVDAVAQGSIGSVVLVANGTYATGGRAVAGTMTNRVVVDKPLTLRSVNGPSYTIIRGSQAPGGGNGDGAIRCVYLTNGAVLSGFTLTNGATRWGIGGEWWWSQETGGGLWCESAAAVASNCVITGNSADAGGGAFGGSLYNCVLTGNSARAGGGTCYSTLYNCLLTGNSASFGGGAAGATLFNCTLAGNSAGEGGGGAVDSMLNNCIVYFNSAVTNGANSWSATLNYCCTTPLPTNGVSNITNAPLFMNLAAGDFRLQLGSPCIDAGTNLAAFITTDILGLPRPMDGNNDGVARFDIGAYEFNPYRFDPVLQMGVDGFRFTVRGEPGRTVRIDRSRDLIHWEPAGWVPIPASGQTLIDPAATSEPKLFYRMLREP